MKHAVPRILKSILSSTIILVTAVIAVAAQQPGADPPLGENLFQPELIMQHQQEIGLTDDQKSFLKAETRRVQQSFVELQWQMQDEFEKLFGSLKGERIDETQALAELDKVLDIERQVKRLQIGLLIRIKNNLTPEQQAKLAEIRKHWTPDKAPK